MMTLIQEQRFAPVHMLEGDTFQVAFKYRGFDKAIVELPGKERKFNVLRVYEGDFDGISNAVIAVLGWIE